MIQKFKKYKFHLLAFIIPIVVLGFIYIIRCQLRGATFFISDSYYLSYFSKRQFERHSYPLKNTMYYFCSFCKNFFQAMAKYFSGRLLL